MSGNARERILIALRHLTFASGFDAVSVRDIVARADVARSTFYENFEDKDDGVRAILEPLLLPFADACTAQFDRSRLSAALTHVRATPAAREIAAGTRRALVVGQLAALIQERLELMCRRMSPASEIPPSLVGTWIAEAQIGVIAAWLEADAPAPVEHIAALIATAARGCANAFLSPRSPK